MNAMNSKVEGRPKHLISKSKKKTSMVVTEDFTTTSWEKVMIVSPIKIAILPAMRRGCQNTCLIWGAIGGLTLIPKALGMLKSSKEENDVVVELFPISKSCALIFFDNLSDTMRFFSKPIKIANFPKVY